MGGYTPLVMSKGNLIDERKQTPKSPGSMSFIGKSSYYNPISNPVPSFSQNPYILREKQLLLANKSHSSLTTPPSQ